VKAYSLPFRVLSFFATHPGMPGHGLFTVMNEVGATSVHQRITHELRGWGIRRYKDNEGLHRYWMPRAEAKRALAYLSEILDAQKERAA
jgi:hypothetical protein